MNNYQTNMLAVILLLTSGFCDAQNNDNLMGPAPTNMQAENVQAKTEKDSAIDISGFVRVIGGYLNTKADSFDGYTNEFTITNETLLGLRGEVQVFNTLSIVGQGLLRASRNRDSEVQWLYADYRPNDTLSFKIGRQRLPLYQYSEIIDVGFAYPWITLPLEVYSPLLFTDYDGILGAYEFSSKSVSGTIDAYAGIFKGDISGGDIEYYVDAKNLFGVVTTINIDELSFRASYHTTDAEVVISESIQFQNILTQFGFVESARAFSVDDKVEYYQFSAGWENVDYFARVELTNYNSDAYYVPNTTSGFVSLGYNFYPYTFHVTTAKSTAKYGEAPNEIPLGISPQLDFLAQQFDFAINSVSANDQQTLTVGLRYELKTNIALKADITFINSQINTNNNAASAGSFGVSEDAELYQVAIEWVF